MTERIAGLPMYDWPELADAIDELWSRIAHAATGRGVDVPDLLTRPTHLVDLWRDPRMILGQVCSLNPVRDGLGETIVIGTIVYEPPPSLPQPEPGSYYSVIVCHADDVRVDDSGLLIEGDGAPDALRALDGATVAANGTDSQSGYWSLGHYVRGIVDEGPLFGRVVFTGAHRDSLRAVADGDADIAAIDVHSWRLATDHERALTERLRIIGTTPPTPGVVCVVAWELAHHREALDEALREAIDSMLGTSVAERLHIAGYRTRQLADFDLVAEQVDAAARHPWHR